MADNHKNGHPERFKDRVNGDEPMDGAQMASPSWRSRSRSHLAFCVRPRIPDPDGDASTVLGPRSTAWRFVSHSRNRSTVLDFVAGKMIARRLLDLTNMS